MTLKKEEELNNIFEELYQDIINKVPDVLAGYSKENMEKAKEMYKK